MEGINSMFYSVLPLIILLVFLKLYQSAKSHKILPPSPPSLPILGHLYLHLLKPPLHRTLHSLSQTYGPIISLRFGSRLVVAVSSSSAVEECVTKNEKCFSNRPMFLEGKLLESSYSQEWGALRRVLKVEVFSSQRLITFLSIRQDEIKRLITKLHSSEGQDFRRAELRPMFEDLAYNVVLRMIAGKRYYGDNVTNKEEADEFKEILKNLVMCVELSSLRDFVPILKWIDFGRSEKKMNKFGEKIDRFFQRLIDERRETKGDSNTMIDHLLTLQQSKPANCTDENIKALMGILIVATETLAITMEWAMSALLNQPEILHKAKKEINDQVGEQHLIEESHLPNLPYLKNIVLETLRLYPPGPLLVPRMSSENCTIDGYSVPRDTLLLVNAWAIHRDPSLWESPLKYMPERFENENGDEFKLMPFGSGRRACAGSGLAHRVIGSTLGSLIQCFEWKKVNDVEIDMTENKGVTMSRAQPLEILCKPHPIINKILS